MSIIKELEQNTEADYKKIMDVNRKTEKYYEECDRSYQHWGGDEIYSMHYGYWDKNTKSHVESLINMNKILAKELKIKSGDKILDAGCGVGATAIWLAKNYDVEVIGITISELQCKKAISFAKKSGVAGKVKFYIRDFNRTGFDNNSFDAVFGIESICHAIAKKDFFNEAYKILKVGGRLAVIDGFIEKEKLGNWDNYFLGKWLKGWAVPNLAKISNLKDYAKIIGFKNIEFENIFSNILPSSKEIFKRGIVGYPIYKLKGKNQLQIEHVKACIFQYIAFIRHSWVYGIFYAEK